MESGDINEGIVEPYEIFFSICAYMSSSFLLSISRGIKSVLGDMYESLTMPSGIWPAAVIGFSAGKITTCLAIIAYTYVVYKRFIAPTSTHLS